MSDLKTYRVVKGKIHTQIDGKSKRFVVGETFQATEKQLGGLISQVEEVTPAAPSKAAVAPPPSQPAQPPSDGDDGKGEKKDEKKEGKK